jgi:transcriptional repressor NrdR
MKCPYCAFPNTRVIDSRFVGEGEQVRRRRECEKCRERFTTYETAELNLPRIVKQRDKRREPFSEEKLRAGMERALRKRPVQTERVDAAVNNIKRKLRASGEREIPSSRLGEWVMQELRELDQVAYVRFASVYHSFDDIRAFSEAIAGLENEIPPHVRRHQLNLMLPDEDGKPSAVAETGPRYAGKQGKPGKQPRRPRARS